MAEPAPHSTIPEALRAWLDAGVDTIGQAAILRRENPDGPAWALCHTDDRPAAQAGGTGLRIHHDPDEARLIALYDDAGRYRPLRSSPDLRHGWLLELATTEALRQALDHLYPAAIGLWRAHLARQLPPVTLREKLQRQTGMYRSANRLSDTRAQSLVRRVCNPATGCLKRILWPISGTTAIASLPPAKFLDHGQPPGPREIPLLCQEACNILVAEARAEARNEVIVISEA